ncbi:hypothetical protein A6D6_01619 [Alcanivorax xiamenensis]|uniref:Major facilitator superfamily (MFS) profile domain-containing protein n=1 Tax=Alcanivorax xiamenensis TaxID=1177156 RepID=A0ABQ6Y989_9GAMM|nr:multidrug effflux MFS transporter [Alcanivorax xiamenensis]KAF0806284.1 hypothetical protein A6D6_01619 [Alcanivorax xiamenensis]
MSVRSTTPPIALIVALVALPQIGETIFTPALGDLAGDLGVTRNQAQTSLSVFFLGFSLGVLVWGRVSDLHGRRPVLLTALAVYLLGCALCLTADGMTALLAGRAVQAFGAAACSVVIQAVCREAFAGTTRLRVFAVVGMLIPVSSALGPLIGGAVTTVWGWRATLAVLLTLGSLLWLASQRQWPETRAASASLSRLAPVARRMATDPFIWGMVMLIGISNGVLFSYHGEAPLLLIDGWGLSPADYGALGAVAACGSIAGAWLLRGLSSRNWRSETLITLGLAVITTASAGLVLLASLPPTPTGLVLFISFAALLFAGMTLATTVCLHRALEHYHDALGSAGALLGLSYYALVALVTQGMAWLHDGHRDTFACYALGLMVLALTIHLSLVRPRLRAH